MDKIKINSLGITPVVEPRYVQIGEGTIEVRPEISYEEIFEMIQFGIDYIINDRPFLSAPLKRVIKDFAVLKFFTNIDFSFLEAGHDMVDIYGFYDLVCKHQVMENVKPLLSVSQLKFFEETLDETLVSILAYRNSAQGVIETLAADADYNAKRMDDAMQLLGDETQLERMNTLLNFAKQIK